MGAGPGDPGLLTRRGAEVLATAEVVVYDRLVLPAVVDLAPAEARRIDVGKRPGEARRQEEIHALLLEHGPSRRVVRLKGGDPFVFGRGAEEIEVLRAAGIDYEIVPGVTSAFAVPAWAGVPVTHRGLSTSVTVVTGHVGDPTAPGGVDWEALAGAGGTIVILMGFENRAEIARLLVAGGRPADTPVLAVQWGTTDAERSLRTTLGELGGVELGAPVTFVVGAVAGLDLRRRPRPATTSPLTGVSVVVTRPRRQAAELVALLEAAGARVVALPVIAVDAPADDGPLAAAAAAAAAAHYDWVVFTSTNAVARLLDRIGDLRDLAGVRIAAVGPATAAALAARGLVADLVPEQATAAALVAALPSPLPSDPSPSVAPSGERPTTNRGNVAGSAPSGGRVLFPRAAGSLDVIGPGLRAKGWAVDEVEAYRTVPAGPPDGVTAAAVARALAADVVTFSSPSTVTAFLLLSDGKVPRVVACIGPVTADAAAAAGLSVDIVAADHSAAGLVDALAMVRPVAPAARFT
ncbi:MAG: uroporphyrinogen-III C-methyltransferase [Acidimicrobiales bacterium]